jgi:hypothetical protein
MRKLALVVTLLLITNTDLSFAQSGVQPHVIVYKTKASYRKLVPVQLSDDKKTVVSYPDPADIKAGGASALPAFLHKGYFLDKRGVNKNTAFINMSYTQYGKLKAAPTPEELYKMIADKRPVKEVCDCGARQAGKYSVKQLNSWIDKNTLTKYCKKVD